MLISFRLITWLEATLESKRRTFTENQQFWPKEKNIYFFRESWLKSCINLNCPFLINLIKLIMGKDSLICIQNNTHLINYFGVRISILGGLPKINIRYRKLRSIKRLYIRATKSTQVLINYSWVSFKIFF